MRKKEFVIFITNIVILILSTSVYSTSITTIHSQEARVYCNINTTYLNENLCPFENCTTRFIKEDNWHYRTAGGIEIILRQGITPVSAKDMLIFHYSQLPPFYNETFPHYDETTFNFLKNICKENMSPLMNRLIEGNFTGTYLCEVYQNKSDLNPNFNYKIESIDGWYLGCLYSSPRSIAYLYIIFYALIGSLLWIPVVAVLSIFVTPLFLIPLGLLAIFLLYLKKKNRLDLENVLPLIMGFLGGIISYSEARDKKTRVKLLIEGIIVGAVTFLGFLLLLKWMFPF